MDGGEIRHLSPRLRRLFIFSTVALACLGAWIELTDQEAYYWTWSTQPAACYYEHPPLQAWITHVFTWIFGDGAWVIRLPAVLGRIASFGLMWQWLKRRQGPEAAEIGLWLMAGSFCFAAGSLISLPDSVMMPFALATMIYAERRAGWRTGLALGLAGLAKWPAALLAPGVAAAFLRGEKKDWRGLLKAGGTALLLQTPVIWWNAEHGWASFLFHLQKRQIRTEAIPFLTYVTNSLSFVGAQLILGGISLWIALWFLLRAPRPLRKLESRGAPISLAWWAAPAFIIFGLSASRGELRFYWTCVAFPALFAALAARLATLPPARKLSFYSAQARGVWASIFFVYVILCLPVGAYLKPFTDLYKPYDLRHSPRGDLKGWTEWVEEDLKPQGLLHEDTALFGSDFHISSQMAWATRSHDMHRVGTASDKFQFAFWDTPSAPPYTTAIFAADNRHPAGLKFDYMCGHPLDWKTKRIFLAGELVKEIRWSFCRNFRR
ncbi:MAG: glycosyltransferase family 39 protein [Bdellovibrionales bacterium]|nr:glycosyltransferase family 39 protein [Bdellovibrionales bacterium]